MSFTTLYHYTGLYQYAVVADQMNDDNLMTMMRGSWYCIIMFATLHWRKLRLQQQIGGVS